MMRRMVAETILRLLLPSSSWVRKLEAACYAGLECTGINNNN